MCAPGEGSTAEQTHRLWQEIVEGRHRNRLLFDHKQPPLPSSGRPAPRTLCH